MKVARSLAAPLPYGVRDLFYDQAAHLLALSDAWRSLFARWGYSEVLTPTYEHYDVLLRGYGLEQEAAIYRVLDREGAVLALRPDITTQVARLVGSKLGDEPRPLRFSYVTNVFRYAEPQAGRQREFFQAGVELIGAATPQADAEVIELCIECLRIVGLQDFQLNVGHMGIFRGLVEGLALQPGQVARLRHAIDRKDEAGLSRLLQEERIEPRAASLLQALPSLCGGLEVLEKAKAMGNGPAVIAALENLGQIYSILEAHGVTRHVILDLGEVRGMGYYTGMNFEGFVEGIGFAICSGGRYDDLIGLYGSPTPAVGFALGVERVQMALERQGVRPPAVTPDLLVATTAAEKGYQALAAMRTQGARVAIDPLFLQPGELMAYARHHGIPRLLLDDGDAALLIQGNDSQRVAWGELAEALHLWLF